MRKRTRKLVAWMLSVGFLLQGGSALPETVQMVRAAETELSSEDVQYDAGIDGESDLEQVTLVYEEENGVGAEGQTEANVSGSPDSGEAGTGTNAETSTESESAVGAESAAGAENDIESESNLGIENDTEPGSSTEAVNSTEAENSTEPGSSTKAENSIEPGNSTEAENSTELELSTESEVSTESKTNTESELSTESDRNGLRMLSAEKDGITVQTVYSDEETFPEDVILRLRSIHEMAEGEEDPEEAEAFYLSLLTEMAVERLAKNYLAQNSGEGIQPEQLEDIQAAYQDSLYAFWPLEVNLVYTDESSYEPYGNMDFTMAIADTEAAGRFEKEQSLFCPVIYDSSLNVSAEPGKAMAVFSGDNTELRITAENVSLPSLFAVIEFNKARLEAELSALSTDAEKESETEPESEDGTERETESESEDGTERETESESETELTTEEVEEEAVTYAYTQPGTPCINSSEYTKVTTGSRTYSSAYTFLRGNSNSKQELWYDSSLVLAGTMEAAGKQFLMPKSTDAKGKFGFRITNVGYNRAAACNLDLLVTVTNFQNYCYTRAGRLVSDVYPMICMDNQLNIYFHGGLPDFELKCDVVKSGTSQSVAGNYRFMWLDIDGTQRYGFALQSGTMSAKYCLSDSDINYKNETKFGRSYHVLYAPESSTAITEMKRTVMFETSNTSGFWIFVGQNGDGTADPQYTAANIRDRYTDAADGVYNHASFSGLGWNGIAYGPTQLPAPLTKYVSNDGGSWNSSNTLSSLSGEFWYMLEMYVPQEQPDYYYSQLKIQDSLPAGVDYVGNLSVTKAETGETMGNISSAVSGDVLTLDAASAASQDAFYGYTYRIKFKVKMDITELTPSYSGSTATYTVQNKAVLTGMHKSDSSASTTTSNTVTTMVSDTRITPDKPQKWIHSNNSYVSVTEYTEKNVSVTFSIIQKVPAYSNAWIPSAIAFSDVLESGFAFESATLYLNNAQQGTWTSGSSGTAKGGWLFTQNGQNLLFKTNSGVSMAYSGGEIRLDLTVKVQENSDFTSYYKNAGTTSGYIEIPNIAATTFYWNGGDTKEFSQQTGQVLVRLLEKGTIQIRKAAEDGQVLSDAVFEIIVKNDILSPGGTLLVAAGTRIAAVRTEEDGRTEAVECYPGVYTVKEIQPPPGYAAAGTAQEVSITAGGSNTSGNGSSSSGNISTASNRIVTVQNERTVVWLKKVSELASDETEQLAIAGVQFEVWNKADGASDQAVTYTTDEKGLICLEGLLPGTYCYTELNTPQGYASDDQIYEFTIDSNGLCSQENNHIILCENQFIQADFAKTDKATGDLVAGAKLQLTDQSGTVIDTWISGETPHRICRLPVGSYLLKELEAPDGYQMGEPVAVILDDTDELQSFQLDNSRLVEIEITKSISAEEIVWPHGNPTFTFCLDGTDLYGNAHCYYETVEFTEAETADSGTVSLTAHFQVPAGTYRAYETNVIRYQLAGIENVENGTVAGVGVVFDLEQNLKGAATFVNRKRNDSNLSDTDFIRNTIIQ